VFAQAARLMPSAPPPIAASVSPSRMYCDAETIACTPLPHGRFTVIAPDECGSPPFTPTTREMYLSRASPGITLPITHWPISAGSAFDRAMASLTTRAPSSAGARSFRLPT
jgi:hypothetical protein